MSENSHNERPAVLKAGFLNVPTVALTSVSY